MFGGFAEDDDEAWSIAEFAGVVLGCGLVHGAAVGAGRRPGEEVIRPWERTCSSRPCHRGIAEIRRRAISARWGSSAAKGGAAAAVAARLLELLLVDLQGGRPGG